MRGKKVGMWMLLAGGIIIAILISCPLYKAWCEQGDRVEAARTKKQEAVEKMFKEAGVQYPPDRVLIRNFKLEKELELWAAEDGGKYEKIKTYDVRTLSGSIGPKRKEGDRQVPEGVYKVERFNPQSRFHLSLGMDYPNRSDRILGDKRSPGGDIFIHGGWQTIGCVPVGDSSIREIYLIALDSKTKSGRQADVHMFPCRFDEEDCAFELEALKKEIPGYCSLIDSLSRVYSYFNNENKLPGVSIDENGTYLIDKE